MDTLALGYTLPAIGRVTDLHRLENVRAGRTRKTPESLIFDSGVFSIKNGSETGQAREDQVMWTFLVGEADKTSR